jgi:hypothetical protein
MHEHGAQCRAHIKTAAQAHRRHGVDRVGHTSGGNIDAAELQRLAEAQQVVNERGVHRFSVVSGRVPVANVHVRRSSSG